uniref:Uncharacterized protein n=1 Tax=Rhizophagus irregularis (strain DAOM 181602 / DAOM 197198 / MUCL 43194) TaxID=747089 RepID=U9UST1_RHIID
MLEEKDEVVSTQGINMEKSAEINLILPELKLSSTYHTRDCKIKIVPDNENIVLTAKKVLNENAEFGVRDDIENKIEISISKKLGKISSCNGY